MSIIFVVVSFISAGRQQIKVEKMQLDAVVPNSLPETFVNVRGLTFLLSHIHKIIVIYYYPSIKLWIYDCHDMSAVKS